MILIPGLFVIFAVYSGAMQVFAFSLGVALMSRENINNITMNYFWGIISFVFAISAMITWTL